MPSAARFSDMWSGICECHHHPQEVAGMIITGSADVNSGNLGQARVTDMTIAYCDEQHTGQVITGAPNAFANSLNKARVGDQVVGCNIGIIVTGNTTHQICDGGGSPAPYEVVQFQGHTILYTEVDFGNLDDEVEVNDGLNVYRPSGGAPTKAEISRSKALETAPKTTVAADAAPPPAQATPPTNCVDIPDVPPDNFQLSTNFILSEVSSRAAVSHYPVRAQQGLTAADIVCNLQAWAQNVGEVLCTQYGKRTLLVTSGFRTGSSVSQHEKGQACDVQFPGKTNSQIYEIAQWIKVNVPYDQMILEYAGNRPWIHLSFNRAGNRASSASNKFGTCTSGSTYVWGQLLNRA